MPPAGFQIDFFGVIVGIPPAFAWPPLVPNASDDEFNFRIIFDVTLY